MLNSSRPPSAGSPSFSHPKWAILLRVIGLLMPVYFAAFLFLQPALNKPSPSILTENLIIVVGTSFLAASFAFFLLRTTRDIQHSRVFFFAYGFLAFAGFSIIYTITTPNFTLPLPASPDSISRTASYLALFLAAVCFVLAQTKLAIIISSIASSLRSSGLLVILGTIMIGFLFLAFHNPAAIIHLAWTTFPNNILMGSVTVVLLAYSAHHYLESYSKTHFALQLNLAVSMLFLIESQVILIFAPFGSRSGSLYHFTSMAGVGLALLSLLVQYQAGTPLRSLVEETLGLKVDLQGEVASLNVLAALSAAIEARDNDVAGHNGRVADLCVRVGRTMGLDNARLRVLAHAGLLHDIGKLAMPDNLLHKPALLTDEEMLTMRTHPLRGLDILAKLGQFDQETAVIMTHHERINGSGYPHGLLGSLIPIEGRILAVVDTYDAIVSDRPYRAGRASTLACTILRKERGVTLDADCVDALLRVIALQP